MADPEQLTTFAERGAELLRAGQLVAVPTDTQYALSALSGQGGAVMQCFALKRRSDDDAMPIFLPNMSWLDVVATDVSDEARSLAEAVWPGALTLVLRRNPEWRSLAAPGKTVAVRIPYHPLALALLSAVDAPLTGSSANRHGEPAALTAEQVNDVFGDDVTVMPTLGIGPQGTASTILDCSGDAPQIVRSGAVDEARVADVLGHHLATSSS
jgi:tRNA threonylcarbamoyl adenosine modification protein (Sua5/YciO/YrdC/YwlC family)